MSGQRAAKLAQHSAGGVHRPAQGTATVSGGCVNPIRLRGYYQRISAETGEVLELVGSPDTGDGLLVIACKDRRECRCPACASLYQRDAYQLIAAGFRGGKSVPESVGTHPAVVLTLTAPSFGPVHGNRDHDRPCKCGIRHDPNDPELGSAIDPTTYRYTEQVTWNHDAPRLWRRTVQAIRRGLARELGIPRSKLAQTARVRFAKVAEFQRRGVVHYHAIIRIDGPGGPEIPPPPQCTTALLERVVASAGTAVSVRVAPNDRAVSVRWGRQLEVAALDRTTCTTAGYIAKYATKATETATGGTLIAPVRSVSELDWIDVPEHARRLVRASWLTAEHTGEQALKRWAHQFGYGGHTLTKSHQYSVTFALLRAARADWHHQGTDEGSVIVRAKLKYAGRGHRRTAASTKEEQA